MSPRKALRIAALVAVILLVFGAQIVRIVQHDPDLHVVEVSFVSDDALVLAMHDLYGLARVYGEKPQRFNFLIDNLLAAYESPDRDLARRVRQELIARYEGKGE